MRYGIRSHFIKFIARLMVEILKKEIFGEVFLLKHFLSPDECEWHIDNGERRGFKEALISFPSGDQAIKGARNNDRVEFKDENMSNRYFSRAKQFLFDSDLDFEVSRFNELVRYYRYARGQRFKRHKDGSYIANSIEKSRFSFLVYLNDNFGGGETIIWGGEKVLDDKSEAHVITPEVGMAFVFPHSFWHEGRRLEHGMKYVLRFDVMYRAAVGGNNDIY